MIALVLLWAVGQLARDSSWLSGLCFYIPSAFLGAAILAMAVVRLSRKQWRAAALSVCMALPPLAMVLFVENHPFAEQIQPGSGGLRLVHWNVGGALSRPGAVDFLIARHADLYVLSEVPDTRSVEMFRDALGTGYQLQVFGNLAVVGTGEVEANGWLLDIERAKVLSVTWRGAALLRTDGTASAPITFIAEPGARITARNPVTADGINLEGANYVVIQGFTIDNTGGTITRAGIRSVTNNHVTICNNSSDLCGTWGILTGFSDDLLIENNVMSRSQDEHGIYVSNSGDRPVIRGNTVWGNSGNGIHMNGDLSEGGDGIISGALVENNVIYDNGFPAGGSGINCDGVQGSRFQNNLLYDNHASGISLYRIDGGGPSSNNIVVNNTVIMASNGRWALNIQNASTDNQVFNNVLLNLHLTRGSIDISSNSLPGFVSNYNVVMNRFTTNGGTSIQTLAQWRIATGQDLNSLVALPADVFVDPATNDYHLKPGGPAINTGTATQAPLRDLAGTQRPQGPAFDIGAYEQPAAVAPTVSSVQVNDGAAQRSRVASLTVTFSAQVTFATTPAAAFTLTRTGGGAVAFTATASVVNGVTVVTFNGFSGNEAEFGSLRDGRYTLTAIASQISAGGQQMASNFTFGDAQGLYRFYGDTNGDRRIDISDFGFFSLAYLTPTNFNPALDFNNDGRLDISDFGQFSLRYFTNLP